LADSKVLTPLQRDRLYDLICEKALCCSVAQASVDEIDTLNILHATMLAMKRAVEGLRLKPAKVLVDGNRLPLIDVLAEAVIGGDAKIKSISAASILAKVHRDRLCETLHQEFPQYGFAAHKGYATPNTWRRCECTEPAAITGNTSVRSLPRSLSRMRTASRSP
jgi:ribonuclease HII